MTGDVIGAVVVAYLIGGVPIGIFVGRARGIPDIRKYGSGNIGASNVLRVLGVKAGLFVWAMDCLKGVIPVLLARHLLGVEGWWLGGAGLATAAGHCYSPYLRFSGGRGVSTALGVVLGLFWPVGVCSLLVFILIVARTRYISLGSMLGACSASLWVLVWGSFIAPYTVAYAVMAAGTAAIVVIRHAPNIQRLLAGTERKIGEREKRGTAEE